MEGPQIRALAERLNRALAGKVIDRVDTPANRWQANVVLKHCAGRSVKQITSHGRWLIWHFDHGVSWLLEPTGPWRWDIAPIAKKSDGQPALAGRKLLSLTVLNSFRVQLVGKPLLLTTNTQTMWQIAELRDLGPDPLSTPLDAAALARCLARAWHAPIARSLLNQRRIAGIGNRSKCEILYAARIAPGTAVGQLDEAARRRLAAAIIAVLGSALRHHRLHEETPPPGLVYDRAGQRCAACNSTIVSDRSGRDGTWSWYCPGCQTPVHEPNLFDYLSSETAIAAATAVA